MHRSPRVKWVLKQIRKRYSDKLVLDIGFVGSYEEPYLHFSVREINPPLRLVGLDIARKAVLKWHLADTIVADANALPFKDNIFDAVLLLEVLEHLLVPELVLNEIHRVLRPGGELLLTTPNSYAWWNVLRYWVFSKLKSRVKPQVRRAYLGASDHKLFYDPLSLMNVLDKHGLTAIEITTKNHAIPFIRRFILNCGLLDFPFWPMNRFGHYICLIAKKER